MSAIVHFYKLLTTHPGSFLDYSAWISLRSLKSSATGPCPTNAEPETEGLQIARYIFDHLVTFFPEPFVEHDISLSALSSSQINSTSSNDFNTLVYLVNRHLILYDNIEFSSFDENVSFNDLKSTSTYDFNSDSNTSLQLSNSKLEEIISFYKRVSNDETDRQLSLFFILCLAAHTSYNVVAQKFKIDSETEVVWDEKTDKRLVNVFETVFPASLADENEAESSTPGLHESIRDEPFSDDIDDSDNLPLLSSNGEPNHRSGSAEKDDSYLFQIPMNKRETYLRVPLPKKGAKGEKNWVALGFQGRDPTTDFRATGFLGFLLFERFCVSEPVSARNIMFESGSFNGDVSKAWYPAAIISIHMTLFIQRVLGGRFIYRGLFCNLDLLNVYKEMVANPRDGPESVDVSKLVDEIQGQISEVLLSLHQKLVLAYHRFWKQEVRTGLVKSPLEVDASILRFQESIKYKLFDGKWDF